MGVEHYSIRNLSIIKPLWALDVGLWTLPIGRPAINIAKGLTIEIFPVC